MTPVDLISQRGSCMFVSLLLLSLEVDVNAFLWHWYENCTVNGNNFRNNKVVTFPWDSHCVKHRCNDGRWDVEEEGCEYKGECKPVFRYFDDACSTYFCWKSTRNGNTTYIQYESQARCLHGGVCHPVDSTFQGICTTYKCSWLSAGSNTTLQPVVISQECLSGGVCYPVGTNFTENCRNYTCTKRIVDLAVTSEAVKIFQDPGYLNIIDWGFGNVFTLPGNPRCVKHRCDNRSWVLHEEGCEWKGKCIDVGATVYDDDCKQYKCLKDSSGAVEMDQWIAGCTVGDKCHHVGSEYYINDCNLFMCFGMTLDFGQHRLQHHDWGCPVGEQCHLVGTEYFLGGCSRYICANVSSNKADHELKQGSCRWHGKCYDLGASVDFECKKYTCSQVTNEGEIIHRMNITEIGCRWRGKCYDLGASVYSQCKNYTCSQVNEKGEMIYRMNLTHIACRWGGKCYDLGASFEYHCKNYTCRQERKKRRSIYWMDMEEIGCKDHGTCHAFGTTTVVHCRTYTCNKSNNAEVSLLRLTQTRCPDYFNNCHDSGSHRFTYLVEGQLRTDCSCQASNNGSVVYTCGE